MWTISMAPIGQSGTITKTWISSVMTFMADNCIDLHQNIGMEVYSQKDSFFMENFIKQGASSP
jgi:hypothetical protein